MVSSHRKSYSLKIVSAAVAAAFSATFTVSLHAQQSTGELDCRTMADSITAHLNFAAADTRLLEPVRLATTQSVGERGAMIAMRAVLGRQSKLSS